jgi:hypothetical protein
MALRQKIKQQQQYTLLKPKKTEDIHNGSK